MDAGSGRGHGGPGQMGMGYSDQQFHRDDDPHHDGAIAMADLALNEVTRPEISLARASRPVRPRGTPRCAPGTRVVTARVVSPWGLARAGARQAGMGPMGMGMGGDSWATWVAN